VAKDDAQFRDLIGQADAAGNQIEPRIGHFQSEARLSKYLHVGDEQRVVKRSDQAIAFPDVAVADPEEQFVAMEPFEILGKIRFRGIDVANGANHDRLFLDDLQNPQIVLEPRAGLDSIPPTMPRGVTSSRYIEGKACGGLGTLG
jgi:hypothetical protein